MDYTLDYYDQLVVEDKYDTALALHFSSSDGKNQLSVRLSCRELANIKKIIDEAVKKAGEE